MVSSMPMANFMKCQHYESMKKYLNDTDFIVVKINEAIILGDTDKIEELKTKYKDIFEQRIKIREDINNENFYYMKPFSDATIESLKVKTFGAQ